MNVSRVSVFAILCAVTVAVGCDDDDFDDDDFDDEFATEATVSADEVTYESSLMWASMDPLDDSYWEVAAAAAGGQTDRAEQAATTVAAALPDIFTPEGCASAVAQDRTVELTLDSCDGSIALVDTTGTVTFTYSVPSGGGIAVDIESDGLQVGDSTFNLSISATVTSSGATRTAEVTTTRSGTNARGRTVDDDGNYTVTWTVGEQCVTINGKVLHQRDQTATSTVLQDYVRCAGECPQSGTLTRTAPDASVDLTFNGSSQASWETDSGRTGSIDLACR